MTIVAAVKALKKGFDQSETASNSLKKAFSAFQPVINAINNAFTGFAKLVGNIAEKAIPALVNGLMKAGDWMMTLLNKIGIVSDKKLESFRKSIEAQKEAVKVTQDLTDREIELTEKRRKFQVNEAKTEMEVAELRSKAVDKDKYSAKQREKFLNDAIAKERKLNDEKLALAQEEYDILKERSELTDNDAETNDALAAAEANLYNTKREYYAKERELISQKIAAGQELSAAEKKIAEEAKKLKDEELKKVEEIKNRVELSQLSSKDRELKILEDKYKEEKALLEKYGKDTTQLTKEYEAQRQEIINKNGGDKAKEIDERAIQSLMDSTDRQLAILKKRYEEEKKLLQANGVDTVNLTKEYERQVAEVKAGEGEGKIKDINDNSALERDIADKTIFIELEKKEKLLQIEKERLEGTKAIYEELYKLDDLSEEKKQEYADKIKEIDAALVENSHNTKEVQKAQAQDLINTYNQVSQSIGELMNNVAEIWQDSIKQRVKNGKITEEQGKKEFENSKKLQIATAIINGLAGVATAVSTAMSLGPITGPIVGAANSALVIATTAAQIAKIKSTTFDGGGSSIDSDISSAVATPTPAAVEYTPQYSTNVTGNSETVNLANAVSEKQKDTRVYVVESDINEAGKRVEIREAESTF